MGENEEELGLGERLDRGGAGERTRGWAGCAHPASLAARGRSATAGGRGSGCPQAAFALAVVPHPGTGNGPGAVASAQTQMGFRPRRWHRGQLRVPIPRSRKALAPCGDLEPQDLLCIQDQEAWV